MMATCPECGKLHVVTWPELSPFRRGDLYYCSHSCWEISLTRDMTKIKEAALIRRQRKNMKLKKDGTPAKKPGRKPQTRIETPEGEWSPAVNLTVPAEKVEMPEQVPVVKVDGKLKIETPEPGKVEVVEKPERSPFKAIINPLEVYSVKSRVMKANYRYDDGNLILEGPALTMSTILMTGKEWLQFADEIKTAIDQLGVEL